MVIEPEIDLLLSKVDSKYTLCIVSAQACPPDQRHGPRRT